MSEPPPLPWRVRTDLERFSLLLVSVFALVGGVFLALQRLGVRLPLCLWRQLTGLPCAGCGGTRAVDSLLRGDLSGALAMNPLALLAAFVAMLLALYSCCVLFFRLEPLRPRILRDNVGRFILVGLLAGNWIYLLCAGRV